MTSATTALDAQPGVEGQRCSKCGDEKPLEAFPLDRARPRGRGSHCRSCKVAAQRERRARDPERTRRVYQERYAAKNRAHKKQHYREHADRYKENARKWAEENPERYADIRAGIQLRRRGRKAEGEIVERRVVFERDEGICGICGEAADLNDFHIDHIHPVSRGGEHTYENVQVAHPDCNRKKGNRV